MSSPKPFRGRGASGNPANRFESLHLERDPDWDADQDPAPVTRFYRDASRTIINHNESPDVGFETSVNPYRGCEHGCIYCFARPTHEYLGFSAGLDFESRILVKTDAPELLRCELQSPRWRPQVIAMSGVTDCYQPAERKFQLTRRCLQVLAEFRNPVAIITKNFLVTRDRDILGELAANQAAAAYISVTTLDSGLTPKLEPRASLPEHRLAAIRLLSEARIPVGVLVAPVIPGLTDHELSSILSAAAQAGASFAGFVPLRLPLAVSALFQKWLEIHFPQRKDKILNRIRAIRGGKLNDPRFGSRMRGEGPYADHIRRLFSVACRKVGLNGSPPQLSTAGFRRPHGQLDLFSNRPCSSWPSPGIKKLASAAITLPVEPWPAIRII